MTAFNAVRFREAGPRAGISGWASQRQGRLAGLEARQRDQDVATLDTFRATLEDLGGGLGVTVPVSGPVVLELK
jgi:hypothetical protein